MSEEVNEWMCLGVCVTVEDRNFVCLNVSKRTRNIHENERYSY